MSSCCHKPPIDTYLGEVINCIKLDVCVLSSFIGVKVHIGADGALLFVSDYLVDV